MTASELMDRIHETGGKLRLLDGQLYSRRVPGCLAPELKRLKAEIVRHLQASSDPVSDEYVFPHCPSCRSFDLYRENNIGDYQCESCGLAGISETQARRIE